MSSVPRQIDPEATRQGILDAAERIFIAKGFSGTSINAIAQEAGVTKSLVFHHFGSKEGLWREMARRFYDQYHHAQQALFDEDVGLDDMLLRSIRTMFEMMRRHPEVLRLEMWEQLDGLICQEKPDDVAAEGIRRFQLGQEMGMLRRDVPAPFMLIAFLSLVKHWFIMKRHFVSPDRCFAEMMPDGDLDEQYLDALIKIYLEGILPRGEQDSSASVSGAVPSNSQE